MNHETKNPGLAAVFSFIFNGLGQIYNGELAKGLLIIFVSSISILVLIFGAILIGFWLKDKVIFSGQLMVGGLLFLVSLIFICVLGIYSIIDAYRSASLKK